MRLTRAHSLLGNSSLQLCRQRTRVRPVSQSQCLRAYSRFISRFMRAIARIQMRNGAPYPLDPERSKTLPWNNLRQPRLVLPSRPLRKIRNLIIFRRNHAQMRNGQHESAGTRYSPVRRAPLIRGCSQLHFLSWSWSLTAIIRPIAYRLLNRFASHAPALPALPQAA